MPGRTGHGRWRNRLSVSALSLPRRCRAFVTLLVTAAVVAGGCSNGGTDKISATKNKPVEEVAAAAETTTTIAAPALEHQEALQDAIAKEDDVVPVFQAPAAPRSGGRSSARGRGAPAAGKPAAPAPRPATASGGGPWTPGPDAPKQWAVLIGVSKYHSPTKPTVGSAGDVAAFLEAMRRAGWDRSHIKTLVDGEATGGAIRAAMQWLVDRSGPDTFTVFHYSGHVKQRSVGQEYLWSVDNQFIPNTEFGDVMRRLRGRAWVDVAGCEAGGFEQGIPSPSRLFTGSSRQTEKSYEHPDWKQSIWTGLTVDQGMNLGHADANKDGTVTIQEAARHGAKRAPEMTKTQAKGPQNPVMAGGDADGWILGRPAPPPPPPPPPKSGGGPTTTAPPRSDTPAAPCVGGVAIPGCRD